MRYADARRMSSWDRTRTRSGLERRTAIALRCRRGGPLSSWPERPCSSPPARMAPLLSTRATAVLAAERLREGIRATAAASGSATARGTDRAAVRAVDPEVARVAARGVARVAVLAAGRAAAPGVALTAGQTVAPGAVVPGVALPVGRAGLLRGTEATWVWAAPDKPCRRSATTR
jgi:hypothetical protein